MIPIPSDDSKIMRFSSKKKVCDSLKNGDMCKVVDSKFYPSCYNVLVIETGKLIVAVPKKYFEEIEC